MTQMTSLLDAQQLYADAGFLHQSGAISTKGIKAAAAEVDALFANEGYKDDLNLRSEVRRDKDGNWIIDRFDPVLDIAPNLSGILQEPAYLQSLHNLFDCDPVLFKCKLIRKEPGTRGYTPHQDGLYWDWMDQPHDDLFSVIIALSDQTEDAGPLELYPGLHHSVIPAEKDNPVGDLDPVKLNFPPAQKAVLAAGDALFFHSLAPHFSGPNNADVNRTVIIASYSRKQDPDQYARYYQREVGRRCRSYFETGKDGNEAFRGFLSKMNAL